MNKKVGMLTFTAIFVVISCTLSLIPLGKSSIIMQETVITPSPSSPSATLDTNSTVVPSSTPLTDSVSSAPASTWTSTVAIVIVLLTIIVVVMVVGKRKA